MNSQVTVIIYASVTWIWKWLFLFNQNRGLVWKAGAKKNKDGHFKKSHPSLGLDSTPGLTNRKQNGACSSQLSPYPQLQSTGKRLGWAGVGRGYRSCPCPCDVCFLDKTKWERRLQEEHRETGMPAVRWPAFLLQLNLCWEISVQE